jgi:hypothetical protein
MFTADYYIDQVQDSKKALVKMMITNEVVANAMNDYIDNQTEYTKKYMAETNKMLTNVTSETVKSAQSMFKFDPIRFTEELSKSFYNTKKK